MNNENQKEVWRVIQKHGDLLINKLSPHPNHPKGRNPYAHICTLIKSHFGCSYKDIEDEKCGDLINFITQIKE